jgi:DNA-binding CsgD family transcriptional regulator
MLEEALTLSQQRQDITNMARDYTFLGMCAVFSGAATEGDSLLEDALRCWETLDDPAGLGETIFFRGVAAATTGDAATAVAYYATALDQFESVGDENYAGVVRSYLAIAEWERGELPLAVAQIEAAVRSSSSLRDRYRLAIAAQAAVVVGVGADPVRRAHLLGAADALTQAAGTTFVWARTPAGKDVAGLRERFVQGKDEESLAYQTGRAAPSAAVTNLTLQLLNEVTLAHLSHESIPGATPLPAQPVPRPVEPNLFTQREAEVLRLVAEGFSSKAIGHQLSLSPSTINQHVKAIFNKLGVDTRAQAVAVAARRGLL